MVDEEIQHPGTGLTDNLTDLARLKLLRMHQLEHGINGTMGLAARRVRLDTDTWRDDFIGCTKILQDGLRHKLSSPGKGMKKPKALFEDLWVGRKTTLGELGRFDTTAGRL